MSKIKSKAAWNNELRVASLHLKAADRNLGLVIDRIGPCTLKYPENPEWFLVRSIVSQLISTKAAETITGRLVELLGKSPSHYIENLAAKDEAGLSGIGLTGAKIRTLLEVSRKIRDGLRIDESKGALTPHWEKELRAIKGIGPWTVHMFRIFGLGELDVLAPGDLGLRQGLARIDGLDEAYPAGKLVNRCEPWKPFSSVGTWYVWQNRDAGIA